LRCVDHGIVGTGGRLIERADMGRSIPPGRTALRADGRADRLVARCLAALRDLRSRAVAFEAGHESELAQVVPYYRASARNFLHYLSIRQHDVRALQLDLHALGLSSLGILERHVLASINAVVQNLEVLAGETAGPMPEPPADFRTGPLMLRDHAERLFGPAPAGRTVRIMVTMPSEAATDRALVEDLLRAGMDVMRINCAHDDGAAWCAMAANLRRAEQVVGRRCRIQADLAGPKLRTGPIVEAGHLLQVRPEYDALGRLVAPARAWFTPQDEPEPTPEGAVAVPLARAEGGWRRARELELRDLRGRHRTFRVVARSDRSLLAEVARKVHFGRGTVLTARDGEGPAGRLVVGDVPALVVPLRLVIGDTLVLTRDALPGVPRHVDSETGQTVPASIHCTLPEAFDAARIGHRVWLDDGRIGGIVRRADEGRIELSITHAPPGGGKLRPEKGINFPDSDLAPEALTAKDLEDLRIVSGFADVVALSFLRSPKDVRRLQDELRVLDARHLGVVLKIENAMAFRDLPRILLDSLAQPPVGIMVARGDLAVEVGFERLSELQEEILWLCEAAHVPVIWATQVLEGLAKGGAPTRAEVSDAVMSSRAECVMLNKGPHIVGTVAFLSDVLERMSEHHDKRMALLRRLAVSDL
jgi:pyruvate kinase